MAGVGGGDERGGVGVEGKEGGIGAAAGEEEGREEDGGGRRPGFRVNLDRPESASSGCHLDLFLRFGHQQKQKHVSYIP